MSRALISLAIAATMLSGCGPSISQLVADKHYREAICTTQDGSESAGDEVSHALSADSELYVHLQPLTVAELEPLLGNATQAVMSKVAFVQVRVRTNVLPVDNLEVYVTIKSRDGIAAAAPASWKSLAYATAEKLPPKRTVSTYATGENVLKGLGAVLSFGLTLPFTEFRPGQVEIAATKAEYRRWAPRATALREAMVHAGCTNPRFPDTSGASRYTGKNCVGFHVLEYSPRAFWQLEIEQRFVAMRSSAKEQDRETEENSCELSRVYELDLGPQSTLEEQTQKLFGKAMARLDDIATSSRHVPTP